MVDCISKITKEHTSFKSCWVLENVHAVATCHNFVNASNKNTGLKPVVLANRNVSSSSNLRALKTNMVCYNFKPERKQLNLAAQLDLLVNSIISMISLNVYCLIGTNTPLFLNISQTNGFPLEIQ